MAQISEDDEKKQYQREDIYDAKQEEELLAKFIDLALSPSDDSWTKYESDDATVQIDGTFEANASLMTIRGRNLIENCTLDEYFEFYNIGYDDVWKWDAKNDKMCELFQETVAIDASHSVLYSKFNSELPYLVSPRDFCTILRRAKIYQYEAKDGNKYDIACIMVYSIDETHPFHIKPADKHVRGLLKYTGAIVYQKKGTNHLHNIYLINLDPKGWIPAWIANYVCKDQGMVVKEVNDHWFQIKDLLEERQKQNKRDRELLFNDIPPLSKWEKETDYVESKVVDKDEQKEEKDVKQTTYDKDVVAYQQAVYGIQLDDET